MSWHPGDRLQQALVAYLHHRSSSVESDAEFLGRHDELRDLLEPMLTTGQAAEGSARVLGDFELLAEIGRGGMGVVWEARQRSLDRRVAVKLLAPGLTSNPAAVARLRREAATAARLAHPNLVKMLGLGHESGVHFLAMELVDGAPIDRARRPSREIAALLAQIADGLEHAHRAGIVHRDVKPANILVQPDGTAILLDFGLARSEDQLGLTHSGAFAGTPHYAAPEQLRAENVTPRTDVFALGVTLFELLTGSLPFAGMTAAAVLESMQRDVPAVPGPGAVPPELLAIARRAMELRPEHRYASAAAMAADLRAFLAGRVTAARPQGPLGRLRKWVRREPWRAAAVVMFVLGAPLLGALAGQWWANRPLVHAAEASARAALVEHALADAYLAAAGGETEHAHTELARALALAPAHAEALAVRDLLATPAAPAPPPAAGDEPEPIVAAMHHLLAAPSISRTAHDRLDVATARRVLPVISLASRLAPAPRLPVYVLLGSLAAAANSKPHARDAADVLAQRWPDVPAAQRARARALRAVDVKASIELLRRYVAANPRDASLRFDLVAALCVAGDKEGALEESRLLPELAPNDPMAHICLAEHFAKAGRAPEAVPSYRHALALDPNNPITNYNLGFALGEAGQLEESLTYLRRATELKPDHAQAWVNISATLFELGRGSEGRAAVDAAVAAAPDLPQAHANRRKLALETRDWPLLWQELTRWVGRQPHHVEGHREVAEFLLCRDVAAPYGSAADALGAALRAFALSQWTDAEAAELGARAWRLLGNPMAAEVMAQMVVPVTANARR